MREFTEEHKANLSRASKALSKRRSVYYEEHGRVCCDCKEHKTIDNFHKAKGATKSGILYLAVCKECMKLRFRIWSKTEAGIKSSLERRKRNYSTERHTITSRVYIRKRRVEWYKKFIELGLDKCSVCGYNKNISALDFHHVNSNLKDYAISKKTTVPFKDIYLEELSKVVCLCSNCHREQHHPEHMFSMQEFCSQYQDFLSCSED